MRDTRFKIGDFAIIKYASLGDFYTKGEIVQIYGINNTISKHETYYSIINERGHIQIIKAKNLGRPHLYNITGVTIKGDNTTVIINNTEYQVVKDIDDPRDDEKAILMCLAKANGYTYTDIAKLAKNATREHKFSKGDIVAYIKNGKVTKSEVIKYCNNSILVKADNYNYEIVLEDLCTLYTPLKRIKKYEKENKTYKPI